MPPGSACVRSAPEVPSEGHIALILRASAGCAHPVSCRVQLLGDAARGWAWTRALQGLPANEIHVCGDGSAIPLVRKLAAAMGEAIEVREYQRFTPVEVRAPPPLLIPAPSSLLCQVWQHRQSAQKGLLQWGHLALKRACC